TYYIKNLFNKYKNNFIVKYRGFLLFIISGILAFFFINFMGNGLNSIAFIYGISSLLIVSLLFIFRFFITLFYGLGKVSGGLVVPTLVLGGLIGYFVCLLFSQLGLFDLTFISVYVVVSMCLFFSLIFNMPYTGAMLFVSTILYSNCNILSIIPFTFFVFIIFVLFNKANTAIKNKGYYSYLLTINDINC
ncbi:MAG: chloride channel protein, partial [Candidatus Onthovivens sp.]|nr:chloride channel protein [Candidatus Onthovivens sp.]MDY5928885.1 chloride channel protein [Candidatus Onthovivens sp.]